ncbi:hypothetical protein [Vulgatibacter sp.]|uniref:hypothetical protein n=1 Tax=Vulgatibacter sp. TaxID=1971226 RepID=UPI0035645275
MRVCETNSPAKPKAKRSQEGAFLARSASEESGPALAGPISSHALRALAPALLLLLAPGLAHAAACCLSTSAFGAGRLAIWEQAAVGANLSYSSAAGLFDGDGAYRAHDGYSEREGRATAFALLRLAETLEAGARFPWVVGSRAAGGLEETGQGPGDLALSLRWQAIDLGAYAELPGVAFTLAATLPSGRATADSDTVLGADVTGRGFGVLSGGISLERAHDPIFVRLDVAGLVPLAHEVAGEPWRSGPGVEIQLGGGADVGRGVVLVLAPRLRWEAETIRDGVAQPGSSGLEVAVGPSASWQFDPHWTLQASFDTGLPIDGLGRNRSLFTSASIGIRHGIY